MSQGISRLSNIPSQKYLYCQQEEKYYDDPIDKGKQIVRILRKPQISRTDYETQILKNSLRDIIFFRQQFNNHYEDMLEDVCENARLKIAFQNEIVIQQDDIGDIFYIILIGFVKVVKKVVTFLGTIEQNQKQIPRQIEQIKHITTLGQGDYFGELSLIENQPRGATCYCETDCYFLTLDKTSFQRIIATKAKRQFFHLIDHLHQNYILKELSTQTVKALFLIMERLVYNYGDFVYYQNEKSDSIYFILQGEFRVVTELQENNRKKKLIDICLIGPNECIGLDEFINDENRRSSVVCNSQESVIFKLEKIDYKRMEFRYPEVCQVINRIAMERKIYYDQRLKTLNEIHQTLTKPELAQSQNENNNNMMDDENKQEFNKRDLITNKENNDIFLKFSNFFSIEEQYQPFQINSVKQIEKYRIKSAGYRPIQLNIDEPNKRTKEFLRNRRPPTSIPFQNQASQKAIQVSTTKIESEKKSIQNQKIKFKNDITQKDRRINQLRRKNEIESSKILAFFKLNQQQIEQIAQQVIIKNNQQKELKKKEQAFYQSKSIPELIHRIQSAKNKSSNIIDFSLSKIESSIEQSNQKESILRQRKIAHFSSMGSFKFSQKQRLQAQIQRIHQNQSKNISQNEEGQVKQIQMPLKYFSNILNRKIQSRSKIIIPVTQSLKQQISQNSFLLNQK